MDILVNLLEFKIDLSSNWLNKNPSLFFVDVFQKTAIINSNINNYVYMSGFKVETRGRGGLIIESNEGRACLDRRIVVDDVVICNCSGTLKDVRNCLHDVPKSSLIPAWMEGTDVRVINSVSGECANRGLARIGSLINWERE